MQFFLRYAYAPLFWSGFIGLATWQVGYRQASTPGWSPCSSGRSACPFSPNDDCPTSHAGTGRTPTACAMSCTRRSTKA